MSMPNYPNPARRARILEAQQLREQGLTIRKIAAIMDCSVSTAHGYLRDYELFRTDLIQELAADQIVSHMIQLADPDDPQHEQRLADIRELRLLLTSLPQIRRDEDDRHQQLIGGGVCVDKYGNRYTLPARFYPPTPEEQDASQQPPEKSPAGRPNPDVPLAYIPEPTRTEPNTPEQHDTNSVAPRPACPGQRPGDAEPSAPTAASVPDSDSPQPTRTQPNKPEHDPAPNPAHNGTSANSSQNSPPPTSVAPRPASPGQRPGDAGPSPPATATSKEHASPQPPAAA